MNRKGFLSTPIIIGALLIISLVANFYLFLHRNYTPPAQTTYLSLSTTPTSTGHENNQPIVPLSISFISPKDGDTVSGKVKVVVSVSGGDLIKHVDLVKDGDVVGTATSSPYIFTWNTTKDFNGGHSLSAFAFCSADTSGWFRNLNLATDYNGAYYLQDFGICNIYSRVSVNVISDVPPPPPPPPPRGCPGGPCLE